MSLIMKLLLQIVIYLLNYLVGFLAKHQDLKGILDNDQYDQLIFKIFSFICTNILFFSNYSIIKR